MSRHLCELKNLFTELRNRYGEHDESVQEVKCELEAVEATESALQSLLIEPGDGYLKPPRRHSWEGFSGLLH